MNRDIRRFFLTIIGFLLVGSYASGQVALYDNLDNVVDDGFFIDAGGPDRRFAQQFLTTEHSTIDNVTLSLLRTGAEPTGIVQVELWHDNGSNSPMAVDQPNRKIADLGSIADVTQMPIGVSQQVSFSDLNLTLDQNSPYWVVLNFSGLEGDLGFMDSVGWNITVDADDADNPPGYDALLGTNGAALAHFYRDSDPPDPTWSSAEVFGVRSMHFAMAVQTVPEPSMFASCLTGGVGLLPFVCRRRRKASLAE